MEWTTLEALKLYEINVWSGTGRFQLVGFIRQWTWLLLLNSPICTYFTFQTSFFCQISITASDRLTMPLVPKMHPSFFLQVESILPAISVWCINSTISLTEIKQTDLATQTGKVKRQHFPNFFLSSSFFLCLYPKIWNGDIDRVKSFRVVINCMIPVNPYSSLLRVYVSSAGFFSEIALDRTWANPTWNPTRFPDDK